MRFTPSWLKDPLETNASVTGIVGAIAPGDRVFEGFVFIDAGLEGDGAFVAAFIARLTSASSVS